FPYWQAANAAAQERGWKLVSLEIRDGADLQRAIRTATEAHAGALLVAGGLLLPEARRGAEPAARNPAPTVYSPRPYVDAGGLASYGADLIDIWRQAAVFVDKILKGASPATLPVEQPAKFQFVLSLKAAKSIGLAIPESVLLRADEVLR